MGLADLIMGNLIDDDFKIVMSDVFGVINPYKEWVKWLSYYSDDTKNKLNEIINKPNEKLSYDEMREYEKFREELKALVLLNRYLDDNITNSDYKFLLDFMCNESIEDYMKSKLTKEELESAKKKINKYSNVPKTILNNKIMSETNEEVYDNLSMEDAYVLHMISKINHQRNLEEIDEDIRNQNERNNRIIQKSNIYSLKRNIKR